MALWISCAFAGDGNEPESSAVVITSASSSGLVGAHHGDRRNVRDARRQVLLRRRPAEREHHGTPGELRARHRHGDDSGVGTDGTANRFGVVVPYQSNDALSDPCFNQRTKLNASDIVDGEEDPRIVDERGRRRAERKSFAQNMKHGWKWHSDEKSGFDELASSARTKDMK